MGMWREMQWGSATGAAEGLPSERRGEELKAKATWKLGKGKRQGPGAVEGHGTTKRTAGAWEEDGNSGECSV